MISRNYCIFALFALVLAAVVGITASVPVSAQSCVATLGYPSATANYSYSYYNNYYNNYGSNSNVQMNVPVSLSCSYVGGPLYVVGNVYDKVTGYKVGSANTVLNPTYGGSSFRGQLSFNLPYSVLGHSLQISITVNGNGIYGSPLTTASETAIISSTYNQNSQNSNPPYQSCGYYSSGYAYNCSPNQYGYNCPSGSYYMSGSCYYSNNYNNGYCPSGYYYSIGSCYSSSNRYSNYCPSGYYYSNGACYYSSSYNNNYCPSGYYYSSGACYSRSSYGYCPSGYYYSNGYCYYSSNYGYCPSGYYYSNGSCYYTSSYSNGYCPSGYYYMNGRCYYTYGYP